MNMKTHFIEHHFIVNPIWAKYFKTNFPNWSAETWVKDVWSLFEKNGYKYNIERYSNNPNSPLYNAVKCIDLFGPNKCEINKDGFIIGYGDLTYTSALEQLLIKVICNFEVDFKTFK